MGPELEKKTLVVGYSFALRRGEHSPCNVRIALEIRFLVHKERDKFIIVAQWEVAEALDEFFKIKADYIVPPNHDERYLSTQDVWDQAKRFVAGRDDIEIVIPVANPVFHLGVTRRMVKRDGFPLGRFRVGPIGFDRSSENEQPWTAGPFRLAVYGVQTALTGTHGHNGRQSA